ncbi:MAG: hypothetical protein R3330_19960, partial [Saprospiraceae bacterium]|nr:hypothetical protein [Saprospiraceae bacterium]
MSSPGTPVGFTYYDWQHWASTGRQIDEQDGSIQVSFTGMISPGWVDPVTVFWNQVSVTGSPTPTVLDNGDVVRFLPLGTPQSIDGIALPAADWAALANLRLLPNHHAIVTYVEWDADSAAYAGQIAVDESAGAGFFTPQKLPQPTGAPYESQPILYCKSTAGMACGDTVVQYCGSGLQWIPGREVWYWRGVVHGTGVTWGAPVLLDTAGRRSAVIEMNGDSVAVVYTREFGGDLDEDVVYRLSTDCGASWSTAVNITNYSQMSDERAWKDVDAVFDGDGILHITWNTRSY